MLFISIVVPIYNSEFFLEKCFNSIENQSYQNFEVLMVDDGSTDGSESICKKFEMNNDKFRYIKKDNSGVSATRNCGIENSTGKFLTFVDSDDYIEENFLLDFVLNVKENGMAICGYNLLDSNNNHIAAYVHKTSEISIKELYNLVLMDDSVYSFPWNKFYLLSIIKENGILFSEDIGYGEDLIFNVKYLNHIDNAIIISKANYNYIKHQNSTTGKKMSKEKLSVKLTNIDAIKKTIDLLPNTSENEKDFLKMRIAVEGSDYFRLMKRFDFTEEEIKSFKNGIMTYINDFNNQSNFSNLKRKIKIFVNMNCSGIVNIVRK